MVALDVTGISRTYTTSNKKIETVYSDLSLSANEGVVTLISGESGSGKSSLLRQLALIDASSNGQIRLFGKTTQHLKNSEKSKLRAKHIGFIFQSFALIDEFTIEENCALPLIMNGKSRRFALAAAKNRLHDLIPGIDVNKKPKELSGGQQQRVAIARAIIHSPGIIIADEPTGNLDGDNAQNIRKALRKMAVELGCAVIIVSHDTKFINIANTHYKFIKNNSEMSTSQLIRVF